MEVLDFKSLINQVKCEKIPTIGFTEDDLAQVKSCVERVLPIPTIEVLPIPTIEVDPNVNIDNSSCIPGAIEELQKILIDQQKKMSIGIQQGILRAKVQELLDNLNIVSSYYDTRHKFLYELLNAQNASTIIQAIPSLPLLATESQDLIQSAVSEISNQLLVTFADLSIRALSFTFRLINKDGVTIKLQNFKTNKLEDTFIKIFDSQFLTTKIFEDRSAFKIIQQIEYKPGQSSNPPPEISEYGVIPGLLYNGVTGIDYVGLYRKLGKPLTYLFTLDERGLTVNSSLIDPTLKEIKDAPISIKEDDVTYYIKNQQAYQSFYQGLQDTYSKTIKNEREIVYPKISKLSTSRIESLAKREVADLYRMNSRSGLINILTLYQQSKDEIIKLIADTDLELQNLDKLINKNMMSEETIRKKIIGIPCFNKAGNVVPETDPGCEDTTMEKLGTDPLYIHTLGETNSGLPDFSSQCYWKEFAKALNMVSLMPFSDLSGPPPMNTGFRYWPINCVIPAGPALVLLPIPPVWKPLFVLPTPLGILVCFLTVPIAPIGIPLPSIYLFYIAPDSTKYLALAVNFPLLYANTNNMIFGYQLDSSAISSNPMGINPTNSYKGYPIKGAMSTPLSLTAKSSRAARLAKLAIDITSGKVPTVTNINGGELPFNIKPTDYAQSYKSESEFMNDILGANPSEEFDRQVALLKSTMNRQLDKLGGMQTTAVNSMKQKVRDTRTNGVDVAETETDNATRRKRKQIARALNPLTLEEKISSTIDSFLIHIDNIKFGTIRFPKDTTKLNPGLPEAITSLFDLIEMGSLGDFNVDSRAKSLNSQIKKALAKINVNSLTNKKQFDLDIPSEFEELKQVLNKMVDKTVGYLRGDNIDFDLTGAKNNAEATEMAKSKLMMQETARNALAFTAVALANPPKITIFNLTKKCCEVHAQPIFTGIPPEISVAFAILSALMQAIIDGLTPDSITGFIGTANRKIALSFVTTVFDGLVSAIPEVSLPNPLNLLSLLQIILIPVLTLISIPKSINPLQPPIIPIIIPLDPILKPLIKLLVASLITALFKLLDEAHSVMVDKDHSDMVDPGHSMSGLVGTNGVFAISKEDKALLQEIFSVACGFGTTVSVTVTGNEEVGQIGQVTPTFPPRTIGHGTSIPPAVVSISITLPDGVIINLPTVPFIVLDVISQFHLLTGGDIIEFIRRLINSVFDMIIAPLKSVVDLISSLAMSFNSFSYNIIEAAIPMISIIKLIKMAIDAKIPAPVKLMVMNPDIFNLIQLSIIPAMKFTEPVLKEIAWIGALALCSVSSPVTNYLSVTTARMIHPIMNQDDLPPWERLSYKNPLFAIFLDEIAWRGSIYSTGSLIFQTKTPAVLPYTPTFPILHVTPHLA